MAVKRLADHTCSVSTIGRTGYSSQGSHRQKHDRKLQKVRHKQGHHVAIADSHPGQAAGSTHGLSVKLAVRYFLSSDCMDLE